VLPCCVDPRQEAVSKKIEIETNTERLNVAKTNMELYKKQLASAEEHSKVLGGTIAKLEQNVESLRNVSVKTSSVLPIISLPLKLKYSF
jgi:hypothetical protein